MYQGFALHYAVRWCGEVWYRAWFGTKRPRVRIPTLRPGRMFIRTVNIRELGVIERLLLAFFLPCFTGDVPGGNALSGINHHTLRQTSNLRRVKCADEVIMYFKLLRPVLARSHGLMNNDFFYQLI